ncbi:hypothetical protein ACFQLX_22345 [Streptomyces polyrhachis]|uniref:Uncharacterized protein n=1 Tax=Streptomyces polyrhachis TaxID=1282885 RepID=A0ABW2GMI9_9ACTN
MTRAAPVAHDIAPALWRVEEVQAEMFAQRVFDPSRSRPLILVSTSRHAGGRPLLDTDDLRERAGDLAQVAVIADDAASWALSKHLDHLSAYGGAVRLYRPGARPGDPWHHHPLVKVEAARPQIALGQISAHLRLAAGRPPRGPR